MVVIIQGEENRGLGQVTAKLCEVLRLCMYFEVGPTRLANELVEDVRIRGQEKLRGFLVFFGQSYWKYILLFTEWMKIRSLWVFSR